MTLRTNSATRRSVVSKSSVVFTTSATSSRRGSTLDSISVWEAGICTLLNHTSHSGGLRVGAVPRIYEGSLTAKQIELPWNDADVGQVAISFRMIEAVTNHKFVRNAEAHIIGVNRLFSARRLVE